MKTERWYLQKNTTFAVVHAVAVVVNIVHSSPNTRKEIKMLQLKSEIDPRIVQPKHLKGQRILIRKGDDVLVAKVEVIGDTAYVLWWGTYYPITHFDGWTELPVESYL